MSCQRIVIMAGGTGGHVFPALAVARELIDRGVEVSWLGTERGLEAELVPAAGIDIDFIHITGLRGNGALGWALAPWRILRATLEALSVLRRRRAEAVLGLGGFVTGPGGVAARLGGRPLLIHEQNAVAGMSNRWLSRIAQRVMQAFPDTFELGETVGNPVRAEIAALAEPATRYAGRDGALRLLVVGGSLGAVALNQMVPQALALLPEELRPQVRHQCGKRNLEEAREAYRRAGVEGEVQPFIDDMAEAYAWADLVICRSGALTVSELAAAGLPALLVPFPYAVDDHQSANGAYLVEAGAARMLQQRELDAERLAAELEGFSRDAAEGRRQLIEMAEAARAVARTDAAVRVAEACLAACEWKNSEVNHG